LWNAQWGASRIARYAPNGEFDQAVMCGAQQISCLAFGGADLHQLMATSAAVDASLEDALAGQCFVTTGAYKGLPEYQIKL
jgi:sugar lactone lactonase YvrE